LFISIIFWTRYYIDTEVINRSFSVKSVTWFFLFVIAEGFSFKQIGEPSNWLFSTGLFLIFGFGFYILNLSEIPENKAKDENKLKSRGNIFQRMWKWFAEIYRYLIDKKRNYRDWQKERLVDLIILCSLTFVGGWMVIKESLLIYPISIVTLFFAVWQLSKSMDYKKFGFLDKKLSKK
jgi:hypothetical protein